MSTLKRREFLQQSLAAAAAGGAIPYFPWTQRAFANAEANTDRLHRRGEHGDRGCPTTRRVWRYLGGL